MSCEGRRATGCLRCSGDSRMKETPGSPPAGGFVSGSGILSTEVPLAAVHA